jgi:hypothetical protein
MAEPVQHLLCSRCADEVRRGLLRLLAGLDPLPPPYPAEGGPSLSRAARAGQFAFRMAAYGLIGITVFTLVTSLVTWLVLR